ncbi:MAG: aspartate aminotransferase family protein [Acidobacteria bacterium]|nr:aspartate aminotransferase family protein [Acidobacteriota bacterium]
MAQRILWNMDFNDGDFRRLGYQVVDLIADYLREVETLPVCRSVAPRELDYLFQGFPPRSGEPAEKILEDVRHKIIPNSMHIPSPRYYGLMNPSPLPIAVLAEAIAAALNQNCGGWRQSSAATHVEKAVVRWMCDLVGYGKEAFGTLVSGGSQANVTGLQLARDLKGGFEPQSGMGTGVQQELILYASDQAHFSFEKAADMLGIGRNNLRKVPSDSRFKLDVAALRKAIREDRDAGHRPFCVVGIVGTTNTGNIDPLEAIAQVAREEQLWFHADAAYGGAIALSEKHRSLLRGIERADSITIDPHKWFFMPFEAGIILARDGAALRRVYGTRPAYLIEQSGDEEAINFFQLGLQGSRRFNALKVWMAVRHVGLDRYRQLIERQMELTQLLCGLVEGDPDFQLFGTPELAIVCFRYFPSELRRHRDAEERAAELNLKIQQKIEAGGEAWFATTNLKGTRALRVNIESFRTSEEHVRQLYQQIKFTGQRLAADIVNGQ